MVLLEDFLTDDKQVVVVCGRGMRGLAHNPITKRKRKLASCEVVGVFATTTPRLADLQPGLRMTRLLSEE